MKSSETLRQKLRGIADATRQKSGTSEPLSLDEIKEQIKSLAAEEHKAYEGPEEVSPGFEAQTLPTKGRSVDEDIVIRPIELIEVSNESDGHTLII